MKRLEQAVNGARKPPVEPLREYLHDRPSAMLRFLDAAEHYWCEERPAPAQPARNIVRLNVVGR